MELGAGLEISQLESKEESGCSVVVKETSFSDIYMSKIYSKTQDVICCE